MKARILVICTLLLFCFGWQIDRNFPKISYETIDGKRITNDYFKTNNTTIVIHFHIGCPPAMYLLHDIQLLKDSLETFKILLITENSKEQALMFNSKEENHWSDIRLKYNIEPVVFDFIAECENNSDEDIINSGIIATQCRNLSRKMHFNSSPLMFFVNPKGKIQKRLSGYLLKSSPESLLYRIRTSTK